MDKMEENEVADFIGGGRIIAFNANFARVLGSSNAALFMSQLWYWSNTDVVKERDGWFWKISTEWEEETGLSRRELDTVRKNLRELGVLEEQLVGLPRKVWYKLNRPRFYQLIWEYLTAPVSVKGSK